MNKQCFIFVLLIGLLLIVLRGCSSNQDSSSQFTSGQNASLLLSGIGFNQTGGPLLFNHNSGIATDGTHLLLCDRNNNRVLIWNSLPTSNIEPDLVLGQSDFNTNNPGSGLNQLNWPVGVWVVDGKVLVTDAYNNRLLIWNTFPTQNAQSADLVITGESLSDKAFFRWPWAIWSNGTKLVVTGTAGGKVLIWNSFPVENNQEPDIVIETEELGTPRILASNGNYLMVGDHNGILNGEEVGTVNFFWKSWPTSGNQPPDFGMLSPDDPDYAALSGIITSDNRLIALARYLYIWNPLPQSNDDLPDTTIGRSTDSSDFIFEGGDGSGIAMAGEKIYISMANGNRVVGYNSWPTSTTQEPDFVIGSTDITTNPHHTYHIMTNPKPQVSGDKLYVISGFDRMMKLWDPIPTESGTAPNWTRTFDFAPQGFSVHENVLIVAGKDRLLIWESLPGESDEPDQTITGQLGDVVLESIKSVSWDGTYFVLGVQGEEEKGAIYVWKGLPSSNQNPDSELTVPEITTLSGIQSNSHYLVAADYKSHRILVYDLTNPTSLYQSITWEGSETSKFNLPEEALVTSDNRLFVADTVFHRVLIWNELEDAISGKTPNIVLGEENLEETTPQISKNKLFWPGSLEFDGTCLWVGEYKFSTRLVRFCH